MSAPIKHTCPAIDKYIKSIKQVIVKHHDLKYMNETDLFDTAYAMSCELESCIEYLEDLRQSNDTLREYGEQQEERANKFEEDLNKISLAL